MNTISQEEVVVLLLAVVALLLASSGPCAACSLLDKIVLKVIQLVEELSLT